MENTNTNAVDQELIESIKKLPESKQYYLLGVVDGMQDKYRLEDKPA